MSAPRLDDVGLPVATIWGRALPAFGYRAAVATCTPDEVLVVVLTRPAGASMAARCPDAATWRRLLALKDYQTFTPYAVAARRLTPPALPPPVLEVPMAAANLPPAPRPGRARRHTPPRLFPHLQVCAPWYRAVWAGLVWVVRPALLDWGLLVEEEDVP